MANLISGSIQWNAEPETIRSNDASGASKSSKAAAWKETPAASPDWARQSRATAIIDGPMSMADTLKPERARGLVSWPVPQPTSRTTAPTPSPAVVTTKLMISFGYPGRVSSYSPATPSNRVRWCRRCPRSDAVSASMVTLHTKAPPNHAASVFASPGPPRPSRHPAAGIAGMRGLAVVDSVLLRFNVNVTRAGIFRCHPRGGAHGGQRGGPAGD